MSHPLDRPVWSTLTGRQSDRALVMGAARRFAPAFGMFAAMDDDSAESRADMASLVRSLGDVAVVERFDPPPIAGAAVKSRALCWQMTAENFSAPPPAVPATVLGEADAAQMLALATLTQPGPFFERTHELGRFIGVKDGGRLVAMAGERMRPDGFTEVSGVCTHPDHRGQGHAAALMTQVAARIRERGETPFLHSYASNAAAIALYERLGFRFRCEQIMTVLTRA